MSRRPCRAAARSLAAALAASLAFATLPAIAKPIKSIPTLRVMLNPAAAPGGTLTDGAKAHLESLAGAPLSL